MHDTLEMAGRVQRSKRIGAANVVESAWACKNSDSEHANSYPKSDSTNQLRAGGTLGGVYIPDSKAQLSNGGGGFWHGIWRVNC